MTPQPSFASEKLIARGATYMNCYVKNAGAGGTRVVGAQAEKSDRRLQEGFPLGFGGRSASQVPHRLIPAESKRFGPRKSLEFL